MPSRAAFPRKVGPCKKATRECPCGYRGDSKRECTCAPSEVRRYRARISGPLIDRIDMQVEVPAVPFRDWSRRGGAETSREVRIRVERARGVQRARYDGRGVTCNAELATADLWRFCTPDARGEALLEEAVRRFGLSARSAARTLKLARTIADLEPADSIAARHVAEAIQYRALDRGAS